MKPAINPFTNDETRDADDLQLANKAVEGDKRSLEILIRRYQDWIYNTALRMVWSPTEAEDVTQEVLLKIITKLATFEKRSSFRTWVYRIITNHVINMKRRRMEIKIDSFDNYWLDINNTPDRMLEPQVQNSGDWDILLEETQIHCWMGILLCLDRKHRLTFIIGEIFGATDKVGAELMGVSRNNFRQRLSRARKLVANFINEKCGLVKESNPCHCKAKIGAMIENGEIDARNLRFTARHYHRIRELSAVKKRRFAELLENQKDFFQEHPFKTAPDFVPMLRKILNSTEFQNIVFYEN